MGVPRAANTAFRTLLCVSVLPLAVIAHSLWALGLALRGRPRPEIDRVYVHFAHFCVRLAGTEIEARGLEHVKPAQAYVIVPNHESNWDPIVLLATLEGLSIRFVVKRELLRLPVFGAALLRTGNVRVDRNAPAADVQRIKTTMSARDPAVSILFYAQGTRSRDGSFRPFKKGAFATAIREGLPVLPVATAGTYGIWRPHSAVFRRGAVVLEIGPAIPVNGLTLEDREKLRAQVEQEVRTLRARARARLRERGHDPGGID
ncbi:MAG: lysophospholipid acyltransferase family protein [Myxococcota bacterium]